MPRFGLADASPEPDGPVHRFDIAWLRRNGDIGFAQHRAPAVPVFIEAFAALAHGALVQTPHGPVAIEDLLPGDMVETLEHGAQPVQWRGAISLSAEMTVPGGTLWRIMPDAFGLQRPSHDLLLGGGARLLCRRAWAHDPTGARPVLTSVTDMADGASVFQVHPQGTIQLYHLCLPQHATMRINGLEVESYHPGVSLRSTLSLRNLQQFLTLFPHVAQPGDFGPLAHPRLAGAAMGDAVA